MKRLNIAILIITTIAISLSCNGYSYAGGDDKSDRLSNEQSSVFSPGYINAIKQRADEIARQVNSGKTPIENTEDRAKNELSTNITEKAVDKPVPELKKKTGGGGDNQKVNAQKVNIGTLTTEEIAKIMAGAGTESDKDTITLGNGNKVKVWQEGQKVFFNMADSNGVPIIENGEIKFTGNFSYVTNALLFNIFDAGNGQFGVVMGSGYWCNCQTIEVYGLDSSGSYGLTGYKNYGNLPSYIGPVISLGSGEYAYTYGYNGDNIGITDLKNKDLTIHIDKDLFNFSGDTTGWDWGNSSTRWINTQIVSLGGGRFVFGVSAIGSVDGATYYASFLKTMQFENGALKPVDENCLGIGSVDWSAWRANGKPVSFDQLIMGNDGILTVLSRDEYVGVELQGTIFNATRYDTNKDLKLIDTNEVAHFYANFMMEDTDAFAGQNGGMGEVKVLSDGSIVFQLYRFDFSGGYENESFKRTDAVKVLTTDGRVIDIDLGNNNDREVDDVVALSDGTFAIIWRDVTIKEGKTRTYDLDTDPLTATDATIKEMVEKFTPGGGLLATTGRDQAHFAAQALSPALLTANSTDNSIKNALDNMNKGLSLYGDNIKEKTMLEVSNLTAMLKKDGIEMSEGLSAALLDAANTILRDKDFISKIGDKIIKDVDGNIDIIATLANILKNPTEDQKLMLDVTEALLMDMKNIEQGSGSPELAKATDDLLQMVAQALLAQAIPDLLKESDVTSIKGIFSDLGASKDKILLDYHDSVKPYYDEVIKDLANNMSILQAKSILSNNLTKEELEKLPPIEIDKIIQKLHAAKDKSFEMEYILQQEAKYSKRYLEPGKKQLEEHMKAMMRDFTQRLSNTLRDAGMAKKN